MAIEPGEWVAVDGKSIRGRLTRYNLAKQNFIALVSVFSQKRKVVLHAQPMENKYDSEAHLVQAELAVLDLRGAVVTLDALHKKKQLTRLNNKMPTIFICVKGNQKKLHQALIAVSRQHKPIDAYQHSEHSEHSHGRWEHRRLLVYDQLEGCAKPWTDLQRLICVHRWGLRAVSSTTTPITTSAI